MISKSSGIQNHPSSRSNDFWELISTRRLSVVWYRQFLNQALVVETDTSEDYAMSRDQVGWSTCSSTTRVVQAIAELERILRAQQRMNTHHFVWGIIRDDSRVLDLLRGVTHSRDSADSVLSTLVWKMSVTKFQYRSSCFVKTHRLVCIRTLAVGEWQLGFKPVLGQFRTFRASGLPKLVHTT